jgi:hypothetical protein
METAASSLHPQPHLQSHQEVLLSHAACSKRLLPELAMLLQQLLLLLSLPLSPLYHRRKRNERLTVAPLPLLPSLLPPHLTRQLLPLHQPPHPSSAVAIVWASRWSDLRGSHGESDGDAQIALR